MEQGSNPSLPSLPPFDGGAASCWSMLLLGRAEGSIAFLSNTQNQTHNTLQRGTSASPRLCSCCCRRRLPLLVWTLISNGSLNRQALGWLEAAVVPRTSVWPSVVCRTSISGLRVSMTGVLGVCAGPSKSTRSVAFSCFGVASKESKGTQSLQNNVVLLYRPSICGNVFARCWNALEKS